MSTDPQVPDEVATIEAPPTEVTDAPPIDEDPEHLRDSVR